MKRQAIVIGATGLVGSILARQLSGHYDQVIILARRQPVFMAANMVFYLVSDFGQLPAVLDKITLNHTTDAFSCLGTTKKQAGSREAFHQVDFGFNFEFAHRCQVAGISNFYLLSAMGADKNSRVFYNRVKGELEEAVKALGFRHLSIFRPSLLLGKHKGRLGETMAQGAFKMIAPVVPKNFSARPISARRVASAMMMQAEQIHARQQFDTNQSNFTQVHILENKQLLAMTGFHRR